MKVLKRLAVLAMFVLVLASTVSIIAITEYSQASAQDAQKRVLRSGWFLWDPYQFTESRLNHPYLTGLDIELTRAIYAAAGYGVTYDEISWTQHQADIRDGVRDVASGTAYTSERAQYAHYSIPYRVKANVLYLPHGASPRYGFKDAAGLLDMLTKSNFRLGVIGGFVYGDAKLDAYIADPANAAKVVVVEDDYTNFRNLIEGKIDGFLADRIVGATTAWRGGWRPYVEEYPELQLTNLMHLIFSKKTVSADEVAVINGAIEKLRDSGTFSRIVSNYMFPILLAQTLDRDWFFVIDIIGTIAFAISGVVLAYRGQYSIFGAIVLAVLPALGGGMIRDLVTGRTPVGLIASPVYILTVIATVLIGYVVMRLLRLRATGESQQTARAGQAFHWIVEFCDTLGLAAFTVTGVVVAVGTRVEPLWLWGPLMAALTGAGGGVLRDIVRQDANIASLKGEFYPEVAFIWGLLLSLFLIWQTRVIDPDQIFVAIIVTMAGTFVTRAAAIYFGIRSPIYR